MNNTSNTIPKFVLDHANARGTGSSFAIAARPATPDAQGAFYFGFAAQTAIPTQSDTPAFDWENPIRVTVEPAEIGKFLEVMRGCNESIAYGKGIFHRRKDGNVVVRFNHVVEPVPCFRFEVVERKTTGETRTIAFSLAYFEALSIATAIEGALHKVMLGL